jgi:hypothetical protein
MTPGMTALSAAGLADLAGVTEAEVQRLVELGILVARDGADPVTREAYSHEVISFGFWAGDDTMREPSFYSYTAPEPPGLTDQPLHPAEAAWRQVRGGSMALLPYEAVRDAHDPRLTLLGFLQSAYDAGVRTAGWDHQELTSSYCPSPADLQTLYQRTS